VDRAELWSLWGRELPQMLEAPETLNLCRWQSRRAPCGPDDQACENSDDHERHPAEVTRMRRHGAARRLPAARVVTPRGASRADASDVTRTELQGCLSVAMPLAGHQVETQGSIGSA
jgi:hypothetical protein